MNESVFVVGQAPEGGFSARALGEAIFMKAETVELLHANVRDAVRRHFDPGTAPWMIGLHLVRHEVITA